MDTIDKWGMAIAFVAGMLIGAYLSGNFAQRLYQDGAVERGYAEWVQSDNPRKDNKWQWIEPKEVLHETP